MQIPIDAIAGLGAGARVQARLPDPQPVDLAALAASGPQTAAVRGAAAAGAAPSATPASPAFAALSLPPPLPAFSAATEWNSVLGSVGQVMRDGAIKPHMKELQGMLEHARAKGQPVPVEALMLVSMRMQEGTAVTSFLTQAVNNTRQSLQTLVERS
jgi:hypothetical protein